MDDDFKKLVYSAIIMIFFIIMLFRYNFVNNNVSEMNKLLIFMLAVTIGTVYLNYRKNNKKVNLAKNTTPEFEQIYKQLYNENISLLENKRKSVIYSSIIQAIAFL